MPASFGIRLTRRVERDLQQIFAHIAANSPDNASRFIDRLLLAIQGLENFPERQKLLTNALHPRPVRQLPFRNYLIYFEVRKEQRTIVILSVSHGSKRPPKRFD